MSQSAPVQASEKVFSFVGRTERREYTWERAERRWFWDGSDCVRFKRVRRVRDFGVFGGGAGGVMLGGSFPETA